MSLRLLFNLFLLAFSLPTAAQADTDTPHPVVVELFTSQGCSSCPPADKLVGSYADRANVLPLSFHVTYWNYIGWDDPYSKEGYTQRQHEYKKYLERFNVYTPQAVVQGRHDVVGSHPSPLERAIKQSARSAPWVDISLKSDGQNVTVSLPQAAGVNARALLVGYQKKTENAVTRGENRGATLTHRNSVMELINLGRYSGKPVTTYYKKPAGDGVAVLLQSIDDGKIIGAAWL